VSTAQIHIFRAAARLRARRRLNSSNFGKEPAMSISGPYRIATLAGLIVALAVASPSSAAAWSAAGTAVPGGLTLSELAGVSCVTGAACTAVGNGIEGESGQPTRGEVFAESLSGTSLSPTGISSTASVSLDLTAVSCPSASFCVAVGASEGTSLGAAAPHPHPFHRDLQRRRVDAGRGPLPGRRRRGVAFLGFLSDDGFCVAVGEARSRDSRVGSSRRGTEPLGAPGSLRSHRTPHMR
jgi:hypothetical protein